MLQQPAHDLRAFLSARKQWDVEFFTELTFGGLMDSEARFDCVVLGYNAAHKSKRIRDALTRALPDAGLCVLHQMGLDSLSFMTGEVGVSVRQLEAEAESVRVAAGRDAEAEILLQWPQPTGIEDDLAVCTAVRGLTPSAESTWRTVLEVSEGDEQIPVLLRSRIGQRRAVACTALLQHRLPPHAALLDNAIMWAAGARPDAVIAAPASFERADLVQRKLHLQGTTAIVERIDAESDLDFEEWPLRGVSTLILPPGVDPTARTGEEGERVSAWLRQGGRLAWLRDDGIEVRHGAPDVRWAAEGWAAWFATRAEVDWHGGERDGEVRKGSIVRSRAMLEVLDYLKRSEVDLGRLGLSDPAVYANPIRRLLHERVPIDNCDATVGTTVNALELDRLVGYGALSRGKRDRVSAWLVAEADADWRDGEVSLHEDEPSQAAGASAEEVFEIARCLSSRVLLDAAVGRLLDRCANRDDSTISAVAVMKLREAAIACEVEPGELGPSIEGLSWDPAPELRASPLLAANYLRVASELRARWGHDPSIDPLLRDPDGTRARAISTIAPFLRAETGTRDMGEELVCAGTLAILTYVDPKEPGTHVLSEDSGVSSQLVSLVLEESEDLRSRYALMLHDRRLLRRARHTIAAFTLAAAVPLSYGLSLAAQEVGALPVGNEFTAWPFSFAVVMLAALWALRRSELLVEWLVRFVRFTIRQVPGMRDRLTKEPETVAETPRP
ncbi:MAG TPA: hypothetical protein VF545_13290 [Thermoleophilaceae bacterium]|jgi:hypothetical protein